MSTDQTGVRAGIIVTGTEMLTGRIRDRNGPWIAERLGELGVEVAHVLVVGDRAGDMESALRHLAAEGLDLVVTSGGLGPTADDLTAEVVGRFAGRELVLDEEMEGKIAAILANFARRFKLDPDALAVANRKQATVPAGAAVIDPAGTAPGLVVAPAEGPGPTVIVLPGPPRELQTMWPQALATSEAQAVLGGVAPFAGATLKLFGIPESEIAQTLREVGEKTSLEPLEITTCLRRAELEVEIRHRGGADAQQAQDQVAAAIEDRHGDFIFSRDGATVDELVTDLLQGKRVGLAESCTAGLLAARLTERPGASEYVAGGVVAYSDAAKSELLGVPPDLISKHGAVSPQVSRAMAEGAMERFGANVACAITGIAGPDGGTEEKPVGYVCFCALLASGESIERDPVLPGDRAEIRDRSTTVAMHLLLRLLRGEELPVP